MTLPGTVQNGVVVLNGGQLLPEGSVVQVVFESTAKQSPATDSEPTIWDDIARIGREVESLPCDLPEDLAINHDHYLYGVEKRQ